MPYPDDERHREHIRNNPCTASQDKNSGSARASLVMLFKLAQSAAKGWRKLRGHQHIPDLIQGIRFIDGVNEHYVKQQATSSLKTRTTHPETVA